MMRNSIAVCFLLLNLGSLCGQVEHVGRYETDHEWNNQNYIVVPNDKNGVLLIKPMTADAGKTISIQYSFLNTELKETWAGLFEISKKLYLKGYHYTEGLTYLLFQNRTNNQYIKIMTIDPFKKKVEEFEPAHIVDLEIHEFEVIKENAIIGGYIENRPAVFAYDLKNDIIRTLPNVYQNNSELLEVKINSDSVTFNVLASELDKKKDRIILVNTYDYAGNAIRGYKLETETDHQLLSGVSSSIMDKSQIVVGLYSVKTGTYPTGIFINRVDRTGKQTMNYMSFGEFDTFLDHNGEKRAAKIKKKALAAKKSKGEWRYKTDALFREVIEENGNLIIAGEFFKPWNVSTSNYQRQRDQFSPFYYDYDPFYDSNRGFRRNPRDIRTVNTPSDFNFTHAFVLSIDQNAEILWDRSFDIKETIDGGVLTNFGEFQWHDDEAYYAYYHDKELVVKHLNNIKEKEGNVSELNLLLEGDEIRHERENFKGMVKWYGNRYLIYGVQHVRPKDKSSDLRKVFFVNGIAVGPDMPSDTKSD